MEHQSPPYQPPQPEAAPLPPNNERSGFLGRLRKKFNPEAVEKPRPEQSKNSPEGTPEQPEKTKVKKFVEGVGKLLFGERSASAQAVNERTETSRAPEAVEDASESEPLIHRANRMRTLARTVIATVFGVAAAERQHGREWDGDQEPPLHTENLETAAEDLEEAVDELDEAAEERTNHSWGDGGNYEPSPVSPLRAPIETVAASSFAARAVETVAARIQSLEQIAEMKAQNELKIAALKTGIGVLAVAGVVMLGYEYVKHKNIKREQGEMRKVQKQQDVELVLQRQQIEEMTRRERAAHYERLSEITHQKADETREVAHDLHQETQVLEIIRGDRQPLVHQQNVEWRATRPPEVVAAKPESDIAPLATVERTDVIERAPSVFGQKETMQQQGGGLGTNGGGAAFGGVQQQQMLKSDATTAPLSPIAQRALAEKQAKAKRLAANAWLYGAVLIAGLVIVAVIIMLF